MGKKELPVEEMVKDKKNGFTQTQLEIKYGVSMTTISKRIKEYCEERGEEEPKGELTGRIELPVEDIVRKWKNGISVSELALEYEVSSTTISKRIDEYYQNKGKERPKKKTKKERKKRESKPYKEIPVEEIITQIENGVEPTELAEKYEVSRNTIDRKVEKYCAEKRISEPRILRSSRVIVEYLKKGLTPEQIKEVAKRSGVIIPDNIMEKGIEANEKRNGKDER